MKYNIHIGSLIKEQFDKRGCTVAWLARQLNCDRTNIYGIFQRETIDIKRLHEIGQALDYDFLTEVAQRLNVTEE
ncbi:MAG: XRE family transcriptional regulator [Bacteroidales bacterium]|nr:XRE family transcriptional regulator [Bacteroidales bacterium]